MTRIFALIYGLIAYIIFLGTFLYAIGFVGNIIVPKSIDSGAQLAAGWAIAINLLVLSLFALQHTVMARPAFKRVWVKIIPQAVERSTYILMTNLALIVMYVFWQPMTTTVWNAEGSFLAPVLITLFWFGWLIVLTSTFMIDHFDLFGLKQVYSKLKGLVAASPSFRKIGFYRLVRHPIMTGFIIAFWATPVMTTGHLLFSLVTTAYIFIAVLHFEEKDLVAEMGEDYVKYKSEVPAFFPGTIRRR